MHLTIAYSKIKKRNLVLINNDTYQRETLSERPIRQPLIAITEATGGLSYPIRKGTLTRALRFYPNQFHTSAMKKII